MSHITAVKTQIKDLDALRAAVERLGCTLTEGGEIIGYFRNMGKADYLIRIPGTRYNVGVVRQPDGTYALHADFWDGSVEGAFGPQFGRLLQEYAVEVVERRARAQRKFVQTTRLPDGRIKIRIRG
jgi:hypothetical protein